MTMTSLVILRDPFDFLAVSLLISAIGGIASLLLRSYERMAIGVAGAAGAVAAVAGLLASIPSLTAPAHVFQAVGPYPFAHFALRIDPLAALLIAVISLLSLVCAIYSLAYVKEYVGKGVGAMGFFMNFFIASMILVVAADNAFWFIIFFEMMSLTSYFLVIFDQEEEAVSAGFLYFFVAHAGSVLIMAAFFIMANYAGSYDFSTFRTATVPAPFNSIVFVLGFLGFGAKAGMIPLHVWLPRAHPAAPSHASALMSGVMIKIGIFGIVRVGLDLLGGSGSVLWWGLLVLAFGAVSAVLGVVYALAERDIKRLLAYSSVENIGIILLGVGIGMVGMATGNPVLAVLGLMAGLYHLVNHAVFKGMLFLGAGSVIFRLHTKDMNAMGGLSRTMPWTALTFLIGALAISAIPPLNGFVSEWYTYQSLFAAALGGTALVKFSAPIAAMLLALTGALAVMCFVNAYGVIFAGPSRNPHAEDVREVPAPMVVGMGLLAAICVALGLAAPAVAPIIGSIAAATAGVAQVTLADGIVLIPANSQQAVLSTPLIAVLLVGMAALPMVLKSVLSGSGRLASRRGAAPWAAGYLPDSHMPATAGGFSQPIRMFFAPLYDLRKTMDGWWAKVACSFDRFVMLARRTEPCWDRGVVDPLVRGTEMLGRQFQVIQGGDFRVYCLYIVAALVVLLAMIVR